MRSGAPPRLGVNRKFAAGGFRLPDIIQLSLFITYNAAYVGYDAEVMGPAAFYFTFGIFIGWCLLRILVWVFLKGARLGSLPFGRSAMAIIGAAVFLVVYSAFVEFLHTQSLTDTALGESLYIVGPALIALAVASSSSVRIGDVYVGILLVRYILQFILEFSTDFSMSSLLAIDWFDSTSVFESSNAHDLLVLECYFLFRGQRTSTVISTALTMLSLKRASFVLAPMVFVAGKRLRKSSKPSRKALWFLFGIGIASPFAVLWFYSRSGSNFISREFGIDLNVLVNGRQTIYRIVADSLPEPNGFGTINPMLTSFTHSTMGTTWNGLLHNDTLRVYLEVGFVGLAVYLGALVYSGRISRISFILIAYTCFVLITSRLITHASYWVVLFIVLALIEKRSASTQSPFADPAPVVSRSPLERGIAMNRKAPDAS